MAVDEARLRRAVMAGLRLAERDYRPDLKLGDLEQWDSLGHLELVAAIEAEFGIAFDMDQIPDLVSLAAIRARLQSRL